MTRDDATDMAGERVGAIVVGAGRGRRLGGVDKAFLPVVGRPLIAYSVEILEQTAAVDEVCLVLAAASLERGRRLAREQGWTKTRHFVPGGAERQDSVRAGLAALAGCEWVLVHDAARPLVTAEMVRAGLAAARHTGAALAATPVRDTLKRAARSGDDEWPRVTMTVDRTGLWAAQTPQVFRASVLRAAFAAAGATAGSFTDDASLVEASGVAVVIFPGAATNMKVTLAEDVAIVEALLSFREQAPPTSSHEGDAVDRAAGPARPPGDPAVVEGAA
jgi:2-C-methyl-D-erythritol 4-phosphate cytidylyltransferase